MDDKIKTEYELFLNSKEVQPPQEVKDKVLKNARAHFSKPSIKLRIQIYRIKNYFKGLLCK
jgi:hypothetical protein